MGYMGHPKGSHTHTHIRVSLPDHHNGNGAGEEAARGEVLPPSCADLHRKHDAAHLQRER